MRIRLIASFLLIVLVTIGVFVIVTVRQNIQEVKNFVERRGLTGSEQVVSALERYYQVNGNWDGIAEILRRAPLEPERGIFVPRSLGFQAGGTNQGGVQAGRLRNLTLDADQARMDLLLLDKDGYLVANTDESSLPSGYQLTRTELQRAVPLIVRGETVGYLLNRGGEAFTATTHTTLLSRLNKAAIFAVLIAGFAALILATVLSYSLAHPVRTLQNAASHLAAGDLSHRVQIQGQDEFANLGRTFNHMAESLQNAEESRRNMTADIAHELRNPLAVQRAHLEAIEDGVYPLTPESLTIIEEQNILLTRLVEDLRTIALADAGKLEMERSRVDLVLLVRQVAAHFDVQAAEKAIYIHLSLEACPPISVDPQRIEQILHNLFSNALRFTPEGGEIHCFLWSDGSVPEGALPVNGTKSLKPHTNCYLQIKDSGPGIPPDSLPHIFDRFYRVDKSRTRSDGGTGLGLSIARKLAQAHNGDLTADNHPRGGALFTLSLPYEVDP